MKTPSLLPALVLALTGTAAQAHEGHAEEAPSASAEALPRFAIATESFELVGILDGRRLALYLDHAATNAPVEKASLELELDGRKIEVEPHGVGEFEAQLPQAPAPGVIGISASVLAGEASDLLAGELDIHPEAPDAPTGAAGFDWQRSSGWIAAGLFALLALALALLRGTRRHPGADSPQVQA
jgi:hypothetical protein